MGNLFRTSDQWQPVTPWLRIRTRPHLTDKNVKSTTLFFISCLLQIGDEIITTLLTYIILFSIDFCPIADRRKIELIQERWADL